jgi:hypothetical protein
VKTTFRILVLMLVGIFAGCSGDDGDPGPAGAPGADAVDTGTIEGTVVDSGGNPVADVTLETVPATIVATTDADGEFIFAGIPIGAYEINASKVGMGSASLLTGVAGGGTVSVTLTLPEAASGLASVSGIVLDAAGAPVLGATVSVEGQAATATTAADGTFTLDDVTPGFLYVQVAAPSAAYLDSETRSSVFSAAGMAVTGVEVTLSGRPSDAATSVGADTCQLCHGGMWPEYFAGLDGSPDAAAHSRFIVEGTSAMVYPELWPEPGEVELPRDPSGNLLLSQDPLDGRGLVNVVLCTDDGIDGREYIFKFYEELPEGTPPRVEGDLDCALDDPTAVYIPVAATNGGQGNWGEGYVDPEHVLPDRHPNFGEGKQRYMARVQDVPYIVSWAAANGVSLDRARQDYVPYMPVYLVQGGDDGPKFWQKSPTAWAKPNNTLSRNCAGCHATGVTITTQDFPDYEAVVTEFDYADLNISCEKCHGPGSEHATSGDPNKIIMPQYLTAKAANETCGQCHAAHGGKSEDPLGVHKYPFDGGNLNALGNGFFVPGVYDLEDFYYKFNEAVPTVKDNWQEGSFHSWPDETHSRAHSQQYAEMVRSKHFNNSFEKLACFDCHNAHTLDAGPETMMAGDYELESAAYGNNTMCLACHATHGPFADITPADVAVIQLDTGRVATLDGVPATFTSSEASLARNRIARAVGAHMQETSGMGGALYLPDSDDPERRAGNCASCHMAKIGKLQDVNDDGQWTLKPDKDGLSAVAEGNVPSHLFDIVWPGQSAVLAPFATSDHQVMPNSCSNCHEFARISGDGD